MRTMAIFNTDVAYDLGLSFESLYIIGYLHSIRSTELVETKIIDDEEWFTFNLVDLFKNRKLVFEQVDTNVCNSEEAKYIEKLYNKNKARFNRLLKGDLSKVLVRGKNIKVSGGSKTYYKFNKVAMTTLINGYPKVIDTELTDNEKMLSECTGIVTIPQNIRTQLKSMNNTKLKEAIDISTDKGITDFPYIKKVYNNLMNNNQSNLDANMYNDIQSINSRCNTNVSNNNKKYTSENNNYRKTKFHNFDETFTQYSEEEFDNIIERVQRAKFGGNRMNNNTEVGDYGEEY